MFLKRSRRKKPYLQKSGIYVCSVCGKLLNTPKKLGNHKRWHDKVFAEKMSIKLSAVNKGIEILVLRFRIKWKIW